MDGSIPPDCRDKWLRGGAGSKVRAVVCSWITALSSMAVALLIALGVVGWWRSIDDNQRDPADRAEPAATDDGGPIGVGRPGDVATPVGFGTWTPGRSATFCEDHGTQTGRRLRQHEQAR